MTYVFTFQKRTSRWRPFHRIEIREANVGRDRPSGLAFESCDNGLPVAAAHSRLFSGKGHRNCRIPAGTPVPTFQTRGICRGAFMGPSKLRELIGIRLPKV